MDALELELETVVSCLTWVLKIKLAFWKSSMCFSLLSHFSSPHLGLFLRKEKFFITRVCFVVSVLFLTFTPPGACFPRFLKEMGFFTCGYSSKYQS